MADFPAFQFYPANYNPGVQPIPFGQTIGKGIENVGAAYAQNQRESETRDAMFDFLKQNYPDTIPQEAIERYHEANANQQRKWVMQAQTAYADKLRQEQQGYRNLENAAHALYHAGAGRGGRVAAPFTPSAVVVQDPQTKEKHTFMSTGPNQWQRIPKQGEMVQDPNTLQWGTYDRYGVFKPQDPIKTQQAQLFGGQPAPSPTPAQGRVTWYDPRTWFGSPSQAPTPTPTPGATPAGEAQQGGGGAAPVSVSSPEEAAKLAPGTLYQTPDGAIYRTPAQ